MSGGGKPEVIESGEAIVSEVFNVQAEEEKKRRKKLTGRNVPIASKAMLRCVRRRNGVAGRMKPIGMQGDGEGGGPSSMLRWTQRVA